MGSWTMKFTSNLYLFCYIYKYVLDKREINSTVMYSVSILIRICSISSDKTCYIFIIKLLSKHLLLKKIKLISSPVTPSLGVMLNSKNCKSFYVYLFMTSRPKTQTFYVYLFMTSRPKTHTSRPVVPHPLPLPPPMKGLIQTLFCALAE